MAQMLRPMYSSPMMTSPVSTRSRSVGWDADQPIISPTRPAWNAGSGSGGAAVGGAANASPGEELDDGRDAQPEVEERDDDEPGLHWSHMIEAGGLAALRRTPATGAVPRLP